MKRQICLRDLSNQRDLVSVPPLTKIKVSLSEDEDQSHYFRSSRSESVGPTLLLVRQITAGGSRDHEEDSIGVIHSGKPSLRNSSEAIPNLGSSGSNHSDSSCSSGSGSSGISSQISPAPSSRAGDSPSPHFAGGPRSPRGNKSPAEHSQTSPSLLSTHRDERKPLEEGDGEKEAGSDVKQLNKLKRFLTTLQQFAFDISPEIGEKVRSLVLALVNSQILIEDFHAKLQQATNFPLRPFVVPFLRENLPLLQREILDVASPSINGDKSTEIDLLTNRILQPTSLSSQQIRFRASSQQCQSRPQKHSLSSDEDDRIYEVRAKRAAIENQKSPSGTLSLYDVCNGGPNTSSDSLRNHSSSPNTVETENARRMESEWIYVDGLLRKISDMVERCKETISSWECRRKCIFKQGPSQTTQPIQLSHSENFRSHLSQRTSSISASLRNPAADLENTARQMDEIVREVRLQAVTELQKAVTAAELSAAQTIAVERLKMERALEDVRAKARQEALSILGRQRDSAETCLNCGREANETCSGCRAARYCGQFCQLKHWESHHRVCGKATTSAATTSSNSSNFSINGNTSKNSSKRKLEKSRHNLELTASSPDVSNDSETRKDRFSTDVSRRSQSPKVKIEKESGGENNE